MELRTRGGAISVILLRIFHNAICGRSLSSLGWWLPIGRIGDTVDLYSDSHVSLVGFPWFPSISNVPHLVRTGSGAYLISMNRFRIEWTNCQLNQLNTIRASSFRPYTSCGVIGRLRWNLLRSYQSPTLVLILELFVAWLSVELSPIS